MISKIISLPITIAQTELNQFCQRHFITKLSLFGSVLRDDFTEESDIDLLVEFKPDYIPTFFKLAQMERELSSLFNGRKIDLKTPQELSPYFRQKVIQEAVIQYDITR
jgi:predicted nucleotidyltransferase